MVNCKTAKRKTLEKLFNKSAHDYSMNELRKECYNHHRRRASRSRYRNKRSRSRLRTSRSRSRSPSSNNSFDLNKYITTAALISMINPHRRCRHHNSCPSCMY